MRPFASFLDNFYLRGGVRSQFGFARFGRGVWANVSHFCNFYLWRFSLGGRTGLDGNGRGDRASHQIGRERYVRVALYVEMRRGTRRFHDDFRRRGVYGDLEAGVRVYRDGFRLLRVLPRLAALIVD
jgi:hypothetical protein